MCWARFLAAASFLAALASGQARCQDSDSIVARLGDYKIEEEAQYHRLLHKNILLGSQHHRPRLHPADSANALGVSHPWDVLVLEGTFLAWKPELEPLTYYHRSGPVGAVIHEVRTRKSGADALAPLGVVGLTAGTMACYARPGQSMTFYETHSDLKKLVADTDRYFTYIGDARMRHAKIDIQIGDARKLLTAEPKEKFAALFVELYDDGFDPGNRLTLEAIQLYVSRVRPDGIVALHISNKYFRLEPVLAAIAEELKLAHRVWADANERFPGKTSSAWAVLARDEKSLGTLARPLREQVLAFGTANEPLKVLLKKYPGEAAAKDVVNREWPVADLSLDEVRNQHGRAVYELVSRIRSEGPRPMSLNDLVLAICDEMFQPLMTKPKIGVRKDGDKKWAPGVVILPYWLERFLGNRRKSDDE